MSFEYELKQDDAEYEASVLQCIIEIFNQFSDRKEVADISHRINKLIKGEKINLGSLRTLILDIYKNESIHFRFYNKPFYDALFSLLLLLAKYNPPDSNKNDEGELECPIGYVPINPNDRLLTIHGMHFDRESLEAWIKDKEVVKNPAAQVSFSQRELNYLRARIKNLTPEIPIPEQEFPELFARRSMSQFFKNCKAYVKKRSSTLLGLLISIVIGAFIGLLTLSVLIVFGMIPPLSIGIVGYAMFGVALLGGFFSGSIFMVMDKIYSCLTQIPVKAPILLKKNEIRPVIKPEQSHLLLNSIRNKDQLIHSTEKIQQTLEIKHAPDTSVPKNNAFLEKVERDAKVSVQMVKIEPRAILSPQLECQPECSEGSEDATKMLRCAQDDIRSPFCIKKTIL